MNVLACAIRDGHDYLIWLAIAVAILFGIGIGLMGPR